MMPTAELIVYGRVTADYSPRRDSGFQVIHRSAGLTEDDVSDIEPLVESVPRNLGDGVRLLYTRLADGRAVVGRGQNVPSDKKISDPQRPIAPLTQALVLRGADFARFLFDPFRLFSQTGWPVAGYAEMVRRYGQAVEVVSPVEVDWYPVTDDEPPTPDALGWPADEWKKLVKLAYSAETVVTAGQMLFFRGAPDEVTRVLRAVFAVVRPQYRAACTFDTAADRVDPDRRFWAVGGEDEPDAGGVKLIEVDLSARRVIADDVPLDPGRDAYLVWMLKVLDAGRSDLLASVGPGIEALAALPRGGMLPSPQAADRAACREFYATFPDPVRRDLALRLEKWLTPGLARGLAGFMERGLAVGCFPWWADEGGWKPALAAWVTAWIGHDQPALGRADRAALRTLAAETDARPLLFWLLSTGWLPKTTQARDLLGRMTPAEFATTARFLGHTIRADRFVHPAHLPGIVAVLAGANVGEGEFLDTVAALVAAGGAGLLSPLAGRVAGLSATGVRRLSRELERAAGPSAEFVQAVTDRLTPVLPDESVIVLG